MAKDLAIIVGKQLRARRLAAGMARQRELAEKMESPTISNQTISDWERGINQPNDDNLVELASILGCEVSDFFVEPGTAATPDALGALNGDGDQLDRIENELKKLATSIAELAKQQRLARAETTTRAAEVLRRIDEAAPPKTVPQQQPPQAERA